MNNQAYWSRRFEDLKNEQMKRAELTRAELKRLYEQALQEAHDEVLAWYQRYAKENNLTLREARKQLDARGMRAFKMTLEEFKRLAKQKALSPEYQWLLENASIRVRLDRSQVLMIKLRDIIEKLAKEQQVRMEEVLKKTYEDSYYKAAYETQKVSGNAPLTEIQEETVRKVLSKPWAADGRDFSARIWGQRDQLVNALQIEITRGLISHKGTGTIAKRIAKWFNTSFSNASRLVETEVAYFQERGMLDSFAALGVEQVRLLAVLDNRTSEMCQELDGKVVDLKDAEPGVTTPPFHCYCRTTVVPVSEFDSEESTRAARDPKTGKTVYVPGDLTYKEWYNEYVKNTGADVLIGLTTSNGISITKLSKHQQERADARKLNVEGIKDALLHPLHIGDVVPRENGNSQRFIGATTTVNINPDTGVVVTSWVTGTKTRAKYNKRKRND